MRLTADEREALRHARYAPWPVGKPASLVVAVEDILAARLAPVEALAAETLECWVFRSEDISCIQLIGGTVGNAEGKWVEAMCCLPCRLRAALPQPTAAPSPDREPEPTPSEES